MISRVKINLIYIFFLFLVILSLVQGYNCKYSPGNICNGLLANYWGENGFIENLQAIFLLIAIILLFKIKFEFKEYNFIHLFIIIKIIALIYYLGEEISWGQHFFKWNSPIIFQEINIQKETNLHNISNLFDQLPRAFVFFWCSFSIILINFNKFKNKIDKKFFLIISPNKKLIFISLILLSVSIPDIIVDKLNLHPGHVDEFGKDIPESVFFDIITFNFIRLSELHELIFSFYFLSYAIFINKIKKSLLDNFNDLEN